MKESEMLDCGDQETQIKIINALDSIRKSILRGTIHNKVIGIF